MGKRRYSRGDKKTNMKNEEASADATTNATTESTTDSKTTGKTQANTIYHHCRTKCHIKTINFIWTIDHFWNINSFINTMLSCEIEELSMMIKMHVTTEDMKEQAVVRFYAVPVTDGTKINIQRYHACIGNIEGVMNTGWKLFSQTDVLFEVFLETLNLYKSRFVTDNSLSIQFIFESFDRVSDSNVTFEKLETRPKLNIREMIKASMLDEKSNPIITFKIDEHKFNVKKLILERANSTFFNNEIKQISTKECANKEIEISTVPHSIFQQVISYLESNNPYYLDSLIFNMDKAKVKELVISLLEAADRLDIKDLKEWCEKSLVEYLEKNNVLEYLVIAKTHNAEDLGSYARKLSKLHLDDIKNTPEFQTLSKNNPENLHEILTQELDENTAL
ncbi:PREDICTED: uncharacterized protein LOC105562297 isoform X2 [Vollenhovia emeryi]|uniref:uncharacterized protein LOC105562297 isoform X2 n=1 Tax=Vollenhovia emeryi TaxID=411798 RepID=UPI0005F3C36E|nr:PREDICTED: uncharacterized protein LOC105562297 isoform X2 [Vollenhovia emeryi]